MIRIVIAEDQRLLLGALASVLDLEDDMEVVGKAENGEDALKLVKLHKPDLCVMDIEMPLKSGLDAAEELKGSGCKPRERSAYLNLLTNRMIASILQAPRGLSFT